jgi:hypothetical protein
MNTIAGAGNTVVPAILALESLGFALSDCSFARQF